MNDFIQDLNNKSKRNHITDEEYGFTYQIVSEYSLTTKIIQPILEAKDIIYLFFKYNENSEYVVGPIFDEINVKIKMNILYKEAIKEVYEKKPINVCDVCSFLVKIMYREFMKYYDILPDTYDKLMEKFENDQQSNSDVINKIISAMKLSKLMMILLKIKKKLLKNQLISMI